jgi:predicted O-methyltransferase YrrM
MGIGMLLKDSFRRAVRSSVDIASDTVRDSHNVDLVLSWALQRAVGGKGIIFPAQYVDLMRDCIEKKRLSIRTVTTNAGTDNELSARRFSALLYALEHLPPVEFSVAESIALAADSYRGNLARLSENEWSGDVRAHFDLSSSTGTKGRILAATVRFMQSVQCLELGTCYGMSASFTLEALTRSHDPATRLTTLERAEPQFTLSSEFLRRRYGARVSCEFGCTQEALPRIVKSIGRLDFLFHDAGHSRDDYVRDFGAVLPVLAPGAVVLIDDIRWQDGRFFPGDPRCYEGWTQVANHPRVCRAVEIGDSMGLLLLGS